MRKNSITNREFAVLRFFKQRRIVPCERNMIEISEIALETGIRDVDEVQRALYLLEGKNLVQPEPPGDLTSSFWCLTDNGMRAVTTLQLEW